MVAEGQEGPCCCKRDDDVDLRRLQQTMRLAHWSVCPSQVAPMTWGSVDLDDSVHHSCPSIVVDGIVWWIVRRRRDAARCSSGRVVVRAGRRPDQVARRRDDADRRRSPSRCTIQPAPPPRTCAHTTASATLSNHRTTGCCCCCRRRRCWTVSLRTASNAAYCYRCGVVCKQVSKEVGLFIL